MYDDLHRYWQGENGGKSPQTVYRQYVQAGLGEAVEMQKGQASLMGFGTGNRIRLRPRGRIVNSRLLKDCEVAKRLRIYPDAAPVSIKEA